MDCQYYSKLKSGSKFLSIIKDLENKLGKIILSSNQTLIWDTLKQIQYKNKIDGFGELFSY